MIDQASGLFEAAPSTRRGGMAEVILPWRCGLVVTGDAVATIKNLELSTQGFGWVLACMMICRLVRKLDCSGASYDSVQVGACILKRVNILVANGPESEKSVSHNR